MLPYPSHATPAGTGDIMSTDEVGALVERRPGTVRCWRTRGVGPAWRRLAPHGQVIYRRADVEAWLAWKS